MQHARWVLRLEQHFGPTVERLNVIDDGLATRLGDRVGVTQAAVRFGAVGSATR